MLADSVLSEDDLRILVRHPDENRRAVAAHKVCKVIKSRTLSEAELQLARKILTIIAADAAEMVRRALAVTLRNSPNLPRDVARKLIRDVDSIAIPVLEFSPSLTDQDLIEILKSKAAMKARAVARRPVVTSDVVGAIISFGDSQAVADAAANDGAEFNPDLYTLAMSRFGDDDLVQESFISRDDLPPLIVEKLIARVSEDVAVNLMRQHALPPDMAVDIALRSQERALVDLIDQSRLADTPNRAQLVDHIHKNGRLTPSLILRAASCGELEFVQHALAKLAGISSAKAGIMIYDSGPFGSVTLCKAAGLPDLHRHVIQNASKIYTDLTRIGQDRNPVKFRRLMLERILSLPFDLDESDIDYLLEKLNSLSEKPALVPA